jgi:hypothetical protein
MKELVESNPDIRDLQTFHEWLDREKGFDTDMLRNVAYLSEEIGEVVSAIRDFRKAEELDAVEEARATSARSWPTVWPTYSSFRTMAALICRKRTYERWNGISPARGIRRNRGVAAYGLLRKALP